jgi:hypothetical protein
VAQLRETKDPEGYVAGGRIRLRFEVEGATGVRWRHVYNELAAKLEPPVLANACGADDSTFIVVSLPTDIEDDNACRDLERAVSLIVEAGQLRKADESLESRAQSIASKWWQDRKHVQPAR